MCVRACVYCHIRVQSLALLPSTYFYVNFGMLDGNVKMRRNSKNVHKKRVCSFEADSVFVQ